MESMNLKKAARANRDVNSQLEELVRAMKALRKGDLTIRLDKTRADIFGEAADAYNDMVDMLDAFAGEVTRLAREVGTEGKLGGRAEVAGVRRGEPQGRGCRATRICDRPGDGSRFRTRGRSTFVSVRGCASAGASWI